MLERTPIHEGRTVSTALLAAAKTGDAIGAQKLLKAGADPAFENKHGDTAESRRVTVGNRATTVFVYLSEKRCRRKSWRNISISPIDPGFGEQTAHSGEKACLRQSSRIQFQSDTRAYTLGETWR
jgi:hypothetical protein